MKGKFFVLASILWGLGLYAHSEREPVLPLYSVQEKEGDIIVTENYNIGSNRPFLELMLSLQSLYNPQIKVFLARNGCESELGRLHEVIQDTTAFVNHWEPQGDAALA